MSKVTVCLVQSIMQHVCFSLMIFELLIKLSGSITGQGAKGCPFADQISLKEPHLNASAEAITTCLQERRIDEFSQRSPQQQLLERTLAFFVAVRKYQCQGAESASSLDDVHSAISMADNINDLWALQIEKGRRGHAAKTRGCKGNIIYNVSSKGVPYIW